MGPATARAATGATIFPARHAGRCVRRSDQTPEKWWGPVVLEAARSVSDDEHLLSRAPPRLTQIAPDSRDGPSFSAPGLSALTGRVGGHPKAFGPAPLGYGATPGSLAGVPDDGEDIVIVLAGGAPEIGVEGAAPKLGCRHREADIFAS